MQNPLDLILEAFTTSDYTINDFLKGILSDIKYKNNFLLQALGANFFETFFLLRQHFPDQFRTLQFQDTERKLKDELVLLTSKENGLRFNAKNATFAQMEHFRIEALSKKFKEVCPSLWALLQNLLVADDDLQEDRESRWSSKELGKTPSSSSQFTESNQSFSEGLPALDSDSFCSARRRSEAVLLIRTVVIISILANSTNQYANAFQVVMGFFAHTCHTSERMIEALAHAGISISPTSINRTVISLSKESEAEIKAVGSTLLAEYAYDNFDYALNVAVPTVERGGSLLVHLTSGTYLKMNDNVNREDLRCSDYLWLRSPYNIDSIPFLEEAGYSSALEALLALQSTSVNEDGLTAHQEYQAWHFRHDLVKHGPEYFRKFMPDLGLPVEMDAIPVYKTVQMPARAMNINQSTAKGNADAIESLMKQANVGDPREPKQKDVVDISEYVVLVHGDLSTCERVQSIQESRCIETTPLRRFQHVLFILGLFHFKMAGTNALWRTLIMPKKSHKDDTSLMEDFAVLRHRETGKMASNPGFRRMHETIQHVGIAMRLDCWRAEVSKRNSSHSSLEQYALSEPSWSEIIEISNDLVRMYVTRDKVREYRQQDTKVRDMVFENTILKHHLFLLYEEITYAMNFGDIGRLENCLLSWVFIFRATGKNKYASQIILFLLDLHYKFPEGLRKIVRQHWLCNPTGKPGHFRGVDWLVERNNLYTKTWYGGSFSNHTTERIITESPLIDLYRTMQSEVEDNFYLKSRTINHAPPNLVRTLKTLQDRMKSNKIHEKKTRRTVQYKIPDTFSEGMRAVVKDLDGKMRPVINIEGDDEVENVEVELEDFDE